MPAAEQRVDRYELLGEIATGGMATVYLGRQLPVPLSIRSSAGALKLDLYEFTFTAAISGAPRWLVPNRLDGEMTGRFDSDSYLTSVANLQDISEPGVSEPPLCTKPALLALLKGSICAARDLAPSGKDNTGAPCTFLSAAFSFGASQAIAGTVLRKDSPDAACGSATFGCP